MPEFESMDNPFIFKVLKEWLTWKEIGKIDSASCNKSKRQLYLSCFKHDESVFNGAKFKTVDSSFFSWLNLRGVKLKALNISDIRLPGFLNTTTIVSQQLNFDCLTSLTYLILKISNKTNILHVAKAFTKFVNLNTFHLYLASNGKMSDGFFNLFIKNVLNLQTLSLTHFKDMTDASLFAMALKCPHLTDLSLIHCGNGFTREGIEALIKANRLFSFRMHTNSHVDKKDILLSISTHCKDLLNLDLLLNPRDLNSSTMSKIAEGCTNLRSLTIRHYSIATKLGPTQGGFPHLTCLDMSGTDFASVPSIKHMVAACSQLTSLNLSRCSDVDDKAICSLVMNNLIKLQSLNVSHCSRLSDHALVFLGVNCAALTELNLRYCGLITHSGIQALCTPLAGTLKSIDVRNCYAISEDEMWQCEEEGLDIKF